MTYQELTQTRRCAVEPLPGVGYDYADAFEVEVSEGDTRSPEQVVRAAVDGASSISLVIPVHRWVLGFRLGPRSSPDHLFGWRIVTSEPDVVRLEAEGPLMRGIIVGTRVSKTRAVLTTYVTYVQRGRARVVWTFVGPLHRMIAPRLLKRGVSRAT
jgi:hypothetical protein